jgi:anti-sigma-K factor RskA
MPEHENVVDLLPAYALGSLEKEEKAAVEQHLKDCDACLEELLTYQVVTDQLGFAAPSVTPPPALKGKVLGKIVSRSSKAQPTRERRGFLHSFGSKSSAWGLAGLLVILALAASNLFLWRQVNQLQKDTNRTDFQTLALAGTNAAQDASGIIVISSDGRYGTLVVEEMPQLDADHQYQLWLIKDGNRTNGGVFSVGRAGYGYLYVRSPEPLGSYTGFGVTVEPKGGSPGPTGDKVLGSDG